MIAKQLISVEIEPFPKPRMTRADKWKKRKCVMEYRAFCDELRLKLRNFKLENDYNILFGVSLPPSYSKKKKIELLGKPHQVKPDLDNLIKSINDALRKDENDSRIYGFNAKKIWSERGFIRIENKE